MIDSLIAVFERYPYLILFLGMMVAGEAFLLPAIYIALKGKLDIRLVALIALASTLLADLFWYMIGRNIPFARLSRWKMFANRKPIFAKLENILKRHGLLLVMLSKFVYGTRTVTQILAGAHHLPFLKYLMANTIGITVLLAFLIFLGHFVARSLESLQDLFLGAQISLVAFILAAIGVQLWIKKIIYKKFRL